MSASQAAESASLPPLPREAKHFRASAVCGNLIPVMPAKAGIQGERQSVSLDSRFRGNDGPNSGGNGMNRLDGKVALISGAARGIGAETARLMVEAGARVAIGDVLDERGRDTVRSLGEAALYVHLDVTSEADWQAAIDAVLGRWGRLDILVNNAGLF